MHPVFNLFISQIFNSFIDFDRPFPTFSPSPAPTAPDNQLCQDLASPTSAKARSPPPYYSSPNRTFANPSRAVWFCGSRCKTVSYPRSCAASRDSWETAAVACFCWCWLLKPLLNRLTIPKIAEPAKPTIDTNAKICLIRSLLWTRLSLDFFCILSIANP